MGGLSRASLCGEAGSREREKGEFRESRAGCVPEAGKGRGGSLGRAGQGVPPNWRGRVDRGGGRGAWRACLPEALRTRGARRLLLWL